jgi:hypothetical protein
MPRVASAEDQAKPPMAGDAVRYAFNFANAPPAEGFRVNASPFHKLFAQDCAPLKMCIC